MLKWDMTRWFRRRGAVNKITPTATEGCMTSGICSERLYGQGDYLFLIDGRGDGNKHSCLQRQGNQENNSQ